MASTYHALVPNSTGTAVLTVDGRLPVLQVDTRHQFKALEALTRSLRLDAVFLRVAARVRRDDEVDLLNQFDAPAERWTPKPPSVWTALEDLDVSSLVFEDAVASWLDEVRGAPVDSKRAPWARPGWFAEVCDWVAARAAVRGKPKLVRQWPISSVYRFDTADGPLFFKAVFVLFRAEPAVTAALAHAHRGEVPDVVATDAERGWILAREVRGRSARGLQAAEGVRTAARIQRAWERRIDELVSMGCPRRGLDQIVAEAPQYGSLCEELLALDVPDTLVHGDLHHGNMLVTPERTAIIDWSDAAVGHPFVDLAPVLWIGEKHRAALRDAYLEAWSMDARAGEVAEILGCVYQAISYRAITDACEPGERIFEGAYEDWLKRAEDLGNALQPG